MGCGSAAGEVSGPPPVRRVASSMRVVPHAWLSSAAFSSCCRARRSAPLSPVAAGRCTTRLCEGHCHQAVRTSFCSRWPASSSRAWVSAAFSSCCRVRRSAPLSPVAAGCPTRLFCAPLPASASTPGGPDLGRAGGGGREASKARSVASGGRRGISLEESSTRFDGRCIGDRLRPHWPLARCGNSYPKHACEHAGCR